MAGLLIVVMAPPTVCAGESATAHSDEAVTARADEYTNAGAASRLSPSVKFAETDEALFVELVKLAKFNVHFHLESNRHQKWRDLTYPLARESGTALTFAATLIELRQQAKGLDSPARISRHELKEAVRCGIVGNAINSGASALELAQNTWVMLQAKQHGYSPDASLALVKSAVAKTDRLLAQRDELAAQEQSVERRQVLDLETQLVRRIRQQLLFEFGTWSCHSRDRAWRENTFYAIDSLQSGSKMAAGLIAMKAFGHRKLGRDAAVCALVGNSAATLNPIVSSLAGITVRNYQKRKLAHEIPFERLSPSADLDQLPKALSDASEQNWLNKIKELNYRTERLGGELDREIKEIDRYRQVAQQQSISGPLIGLTGVASSTLATVATYGYLRDPHTSIRLGLAGRITQGTGQSFALINTPYTMISGMLRKHRLRQRGELPNQILEARLKRLNDY